MFTPVRLRNRHKDLSTSLRIDASSAQCSLLYLSLILFDFKDRKYLRIGPGLLGVRIAFGKVRISMVLRDAVYFLVGPGDSVRCGRGVERQLPFDCSLLMRAKVVIAKVRIF